MYVIDALKKEFPDVSEIDVYDKYLRKHFSETVLMKVFDSEKPNYQHLRHAFCALQENNHGRYSRYMAMYNKSLNNDLDFLRCFILDMFGDTNDYSNANLQELTQIITTHYDAAKSSV